MSDLYREAIARFEALHARAGEGDLREPTAVTLATASAAGRPSVRTVLLKGVDERGFVFYTNAHSRKARQLAANPHAALLFFWQGLFEQVHAEGPVSVVSLEESDAYWSTRSRDSQIGAWASDQSATLGSREELQARVVEYARRFAGGPVPRPPHWQGYRLAPQRIEFWQSGQHRLHERQCYERRGGGWSMRRLNP